MKELTYDDALGLVKRAVEEKGEDYTYVAPQIDMDGDPVCVYFHKGHPSCVVGHVMHYLGINPSNAEIPEGTGAVPALREYLGVKLDLGAERLLETAQWKQDDGWSWGESLRAGVEAAEVELQRGVG